MAIEPSSLDKNLHQPTEPNPKAKDKLNSRYEWNVVFPPGEVSKTGAALGVEKGIPFEFLELDTSLQAVATRIKWPVEAISKTDEKATLKTKLEKLLDQLPNSVTLLGDFNAHSDLWGGSLLDERGRAIEYIISERQLIVLNSGAHTRVDHHDGHTSAIDHSIVSESLARRLAWEVLDDGHGSDHFPVFIRDLDRRAEPERKRPRWLYDKADSPP